MNQVFVLLLFAYSSFSSQVVETRELSWHLSLSDCRNVMIAEQQRGVGESYNEHMVCIPVDDPLVREIAQKLGRDQYPVRHGTLNILND